MAIQNFPKRWLNRPPIGAQVNFGHPLAKGLIGCWLLNEGAGSTTGDLVSHGLATIQAASTPWRTSQLGTTLFVTETPAHNWAKQTARAVVFPFSLVVIHTINGLTNLNTCSPFAHGDGATNTNGWDMNYTPANPAVLQYNAFGAGNVTFSNLSISVADTYYFSALTLDKNSGTVTGYLGKLGQTLTSQTGTSAAMGTAATEYEIGNFNEVQQWDGDIATIYYWNRLLSAGELNWLNIEPWALVRPMSPVIRQNKQKTAAAVATMVPMMTSQPTDTLDLVSV